MKSKARSEKALKQPRGGPPGREGSFADPRGVLPRPKLNGPNGPEERRTTRPLPKVVPIEEQRERLEMVERLYVMSVAEPRIEAALKERYGPAAGKSLRKLLTRVRARWAEEESANRTYWKQQGMRRLALHIAKAREVNQFGAVAQLERLLAEMQGTREPEEIHVTGNLTVNEAAIHVVANLSADELRELANEQREIVTLAEERRAELREASVVSSTPAPTGARAPVTRSR